MVADIGSMEEVTRNWDMIFFKETYQRVQWSLLRVEGYQSSHREGTRRARGSRVCKSSLFFHRPSNWHCAVFFSESNWALLVVIFHVKRWLLRFFFKILMFSVLIVMWTALRFKSVSDDSVIEVHPHHPYQQMLKEIASLRIILIWLMDW